MAKTYKNNLLVSLLKLLGAFVISWLIIVVIFAVCTSSEDEIPAKYNALMCLLSIVLAFAENIIIDFNAAQRYRNLIKKAQADITAVNETSASLIDKAERVADKYRNTETEVMEKFAEARKDGQQGRIRTSKDFKAVIEAYPELQANVHTQKLLSQIETTENAKLNFRMIYSDSVARYNSKIHSFPLVMFRKLFKLEDFEMQTNVINDDIVSDEELGI